MPIADSAHREWLAWRQVCKQLARVGIEINAQEPLACAIRLWGEELVKLREENPEHTTNALKEKRKEYEPYVIDNWTP